MKGKETMEEEDGDMRSKAEQGGRRGSKEGGKGEERTSKRRERTYRDMQGERRIGRDYK